MLGKPLDLMILSLFLPKWFHDFILAQLFLLDKRGIARVPAVHSELTTFIGIFQISCLKVTWIYHLANSAVKSSFYLSQSRQQWKWRFITFSPGPQCSPLHPLAADRQTGHSVFIADKGCCRRHLTTDLIMSRWGRMWFWNLERPSLSNCSAVRRLLRSVGSSVFSWMKWSH